MKGCDYMAFKDRLKAARKKSGLTQLDIAKKIGLLNAQSYAQYEHGKRKPKQDTLNKIADALQLSYGYASNGEPYFYCFVDSVHGEEYKENEKFNNNQYMDAITSIPDGKIHIPAGKPTPEQQREREQEQKELAFLNTIDALGQQLNDKGQDKAIEQVEMLTKIPEYRKEDTSHQTSALNAAHERADIEVTEEMKKHDDDIMNDDSEWN